MIVNSTNLGQKRRLPIFESIVTNPTNDFEQNHKKENDSYIDTYNTDMLVKDLIPITNENSPYFKPTTNSSTLFITLEETDLKAETLLSILMLYGEIESFKNLAMNQNEIK
jgi:hypothetical protein